MIDKPILITGIPRSMTSLTASMIYYGGAWGGDIVPPSRNKRNAYCENVYIRRKMVKAYLKDILKVDPMGQNPLPQLQDLIVWDRLIKDSKKWGDQIKEVITRQGYTGGPWFYKGPKITLIWPLWKCAFPEATWIIIHRDRERVIDSCLRTPFMRAFKDREGWGKWMDHHEACFREMENSSLNILHAYPEKMIQGDFSNIEYIVKTLGLVWDERKARALINPRKKGE